MRLSHPLVLSLVLPLAIASCGKRMGVVRRADQQLPPAGNGETIFPTPTPTPAALSCAVVGPSAPLKAFGNAAGQVVDQAPSAVFKMGVLRSGQLVSFTFKQTYFDSSKIQESAAPTVGTDGFLNASYRPLAFGHHVVTLLLETQSGPISCDAPFDLEKNATPDDQAMLASVNGDLAATIPQNATAMINYSAPSAVTCQVVKTVTISGVPYSSTLPHTAKAAEFPTGPLANTTLAPIVYLYTITCTNALGGTQTANVPVSVNPAVTAVLVARVSAQVPYASTVQTTGNSPIEFKWDAPYASQCVLIRNNDVSPPLATAVGTTSISDISANTDIILSCTDSVNPLVIDTVSVQIFVPDLVQIGSATSVRTAQTYSIESSSHADIAGFAAPGRFVISGNVSGTALANVTVTPSAPMTFDGTNYIFSPTIHGTYQVKANLAGQPTTLFATKTVAVGLERRIQVGEGSANGADGMMESGDFGRLKCTNSTGSAQTVIASAEGNPSQTANIPAGGNFTFTNVSRRGSSDPDAYVFMNITASASAGNGLSCLLELWDGSPLAIKTNAVAF